MTFTRVTTQTPCPICKRADWCRVFPDGWAECMRVQSPKPARSGGWMHRLDDGPHRYIPPPPRFPPPKINATQLIQQWRVATNPSALAELAKALGLSIVSLTAVGAAWAPSHTAWAFPMCDAYGNVIGIRLRNDRAKFAVTGSKQGIFLADVPPQPTLFVCEGPTDTAAVVDLGLFAVGRPNCCCGGTYIRNYAHRHRCRRAVVIADNDKPGLEGAKKVAAELNLPHALYVPPAKDLREFVRLGGTRTMIENTLKGTLWQTG